MKTLVGVRPSGKLHLGHYFSVILPAIELKADVLVADYHSPEGDGDETAKELARFGCKVIRQKDIFNPELFFKLLALAPFGRLTRMTQFKDKKMTTAHLFTYPVLMAHDISGYDKVVVGDDQRQHLEFGRYLLQKAGIKPPTGDYRGGRIMSLTDPTKKMSKSEPEGCLFLGEDPTEKIMRAVTTPEGVVNLSEVSRRLVVSYDPNNNKESKQLLIKALMILHQDYYLEERR